MIPSLPATTSVVVLETAAVMLIVAISLSMIVWVVYTVTKEIEEDEMLLEVVDETVLDETLAVAQAGAEPCPTVKG